jgi:hypothetical protein
MNILSEITILYNTKDKQIDKIDPIDTYMKSNNFLFNIVNNSNRKEFDFLIKKNLLTIIIKNLIIIINKFYANDKDKKAKILEDIINTKHILINNNSIKIIDYTYDKITIIAILFIDILENMLEIIQLFDKKTQQGVREKTVIDNDEVIKTYFDENIRSNAKTLIRNIPNLLTTIDNIISNKILFLLNILDNEKIGVINTTDFIFSNNICLKLQGKEEVKREKILKRVKKK